MRSVLANILLAFVACNTLFAGPETHPSTTRVTTNATTRPTTQPATSVRFFGVEGNARRVVFVCDATGTMIHKFDAMKAAIAESVEGLGEGQQFNVIFYLDGAKFSASSPELITANAKGKRAAKAFLDRVQTTGATDPRPALGEAIRQRPDLIYFVSDGEFGSLMSFRDLHESVSKSNPNRDVRINTILFDGFDEQAAEAMKTLAKANGGIWTHVAAKSAKPDR